MTKTKTISVPADLAADLSDFLAKFALSPQLLAREAAGLLVRLEACDAEPIGTHMKLDPEPDPLLSFYDDASRDLAGHIVKKTGVAPVVAAVAGADGGPVFLVLRFWMRNPDGTVACRELDLRERHSSEGVKHALRDALRTVRLDHVGPPFATRPSDDEEEASGS